MESVVGDIGVWLAELGGWAYLAAPLVMATVGILPIPAEAPAMAIGMLFGPVLGSLLTWLGAMIGAVVSYEVARRGGRPLARRLAGPDALARIEATAAHAGWRGLLSLRFVPIVAFTVLNWGAGFCAVPRGRFLWTTAVGIAPGAVLFTGVGAGIGTLWERSPVLGGVAASVAVATVVAVAVWGRALRASAGARPAPVPARGPRPDQPDRPPSSAGARRAGGRRS